MDNKIDITSTALEKGIDAAKGFLDKLITPSVEEVGLLIADNVKLWRVKNQIKVLSKAQAYCEKNNISIKQISLKLLCPLLDYSSIEEDNFMQNKWGILLSNMVDSEQNIENHVFPYILSQLSRNEFLILEKVYDERQMTIAVQTRELDKHRMLKIKREEEIKDRIYSIDKEIEIIKQKTPSSSNHEIWTLEKEKRKYKDEIRSIEFKEFRIQSIINARGIIPHNSIREFELSNLVRLGLVKEEKSFSVSSQTIEIPVSKYESYAKADLDIDVDSDIDYIVTELGELFIFACKEKNEENG